MKLLIKILILVFIVLLLGLSFLIFFVLLPDKQLLLGPDEELNSTNNINITKNDSSPRAKAAKAGYENYSNLPQEEDFGNINFSSLILGRAIFENLGGSVGIIIIIAIMVLIFLFVKLLIKKRRVKNETIKKRKQKN